MRVGSKIVIKDEVPAPDKFVSRLKLKHSDDLEELSGRVLFPDKLAEAKKIIQQSLSGNETNGLAHFLDSKR